MSIEQLLNEHKVALEENTAAIRALLANSGSVSTASADLSVINKASFDTGTAKKTKVKTSETEAPKVKKPAHTQAETIAAIVKIKDEFGIDEAKKVVEELGFKKMSDITEDKYDDAFALSEKRFAELTEAIADENDDGGL